MNETSNTHNQPIDAKFILDLVEEANWGDPLSLDYVVPRSMVLLRLIQSHPDYDPAKFRQKLSAQIERFQAALESFEEIEREGTQLYAEFKFQQAQGTSAFDEPLPSSISAFQSHSESIGAVGPEPTQFMETFVPAPSFPSYIDHTPPVYANQTFPSYIDQTFSSHANHAFPSYIDQTSSALELFSANAPPPFNAYNSDLFPFYQSAQAILSPPSEAQAPTLTPASCVEGMQLTQPQPGQFVNTFIPSPAAVSTLNSNGNINTATISQTPASGLPGSTGPQEHAQLMKNIQFQSSSVPIFTCPGIDFTQVDPLNINIKDSQIEKLLNQQWTNQMTYLLIYKPCLFPSSTHPDSTCNIMLNWNDNTSVTSHLNFYHKEYMIARKCPLPHPVKCGKGRAPNHTEGGEATFADPRGLVRHLTATHHGAHILCAGCGGKQGRKHSMLDHFRACRKAKDWLHGFVWERMRAQGLAVPEPAQA